MTCWVAPAAAVRATHGARTTADEPQYLLSALSLAEDHDLDIADELAAGRYRAFHEVALPRQTAVRADGARLSPHDPGLPALLALPVGIGGWLAAKLSLAALAGALAAALVWVAVRRFDVPERVAVLTVLAFAAGAPLAVYGTQVYPELPAALAVTAAIGAVTGPLGRRGVLLLGAAVVALPWLAVKYVPVAAVLAALGVVRLARAGRGVRAGGLLAGLGVGAAAFAVAHQAWYGGLTSYSSGVHFEAGQLAVMGSAPDYAGRSLRLSGLLLDRDFGLAAWHPGYLLAVPALAALARRRPPGWEVLVLVLAAGWANATWVALTMHGWWFPGRQVVHVLPAVVLAVAWWAARRAEVRRVLAVVGALAASVFAWMVVQGLVGDLTLVVSFESVTHPLARSWRVLLPDDRDWRVGDVALHAAWIAALAGAAWAGARSVATVDRAPRTGELVSDPPRPVVLELEPTGGATRP